MASSQKSSVNTSTDVTKHSNITDGMVGRRIWGISELVYESC